MNRLACLAALLVAGTAAAQPPAGPHFVARAGEAMGTFVNIKVFTTDDDQANAAIDEAFAEIRRLQQLMSTWVPTSDISRINDNAGKKPVAVSRESYDCIARSLEYSRLSDGAFDITYYALKGLWHFDEDLEKKLPDPAEVQRRIVLIDWKQLVLDGKRHTVLLRKKGMAINLGGIGKGYAVDRATAILRKHGFTNAIVQAGGDLMLAGSKSGAPWQAGIRDPRSDDTNNYFAVASVIDHAFSTAGDYERGFILDGKRYHHIIDPKTGYPATAARSVTIWAPDATTADGLDDAVLIMGPERGLAMIEKLPGVGCVIVDNDNKIWVSKRLVDIVHIVHPPTPGI